MDIDWCSIERAGPVIFHLIWVNRKERCCTLPDLNKRPTDTDLLASLMRAMAIMILLRRKMSSRMMMNSTIAKMITAKQRIKRINRIPKQLIQSCITKWKRVCSYWRPAKSVWSAGRLRSRSAGPGHGWWRQTQPLPSDWQIPCNSGKYLKTLLK